MTSYCNFCKNKTEKEGVFICNNCQKVLDRIFKKEIDEKVKKLKERLNNKLKEAEKGFKREHDNLGENEVSYAIMVSLINGILKDIDEIFRKEKKK